MLPAGKLLGNSGARAFLGKLVLSKVAGSEEETGTNCVGIGEPCSGVRSPCQCQLRARLYTGPPLNSIQA